MRFNLKEFMQNLIYNTNLKKGLPMYPKPERIIELFKSVKVEIHTVDDELEKENSVLSYINDEIESIYTFEAYFQLSLNFTTLHTFYKLTKNITHDVCYHKDIEIKVLQKALLEFSEKMTQALDIEMRERIARQSYDETMGLVESSLRELKESIENMH